MKRAVLFALISIPLILLDQLTKYLASIYIHPFEPVEILPFVNLVNVRNEGAAFGLFTGMGNAFFVAVTVVAVVIILFMVVRERDGFFGLTLIFSGALGNLIDRLSLGYVRDMVDVYAGRYHWPAFNVADSALTIGIALLLIGTLFPKPRAPLTE